MLLATPKNMEKCKDIPGVVALNIETGEEFNADVGNYFLMQDNQCLEMGDSQLILAVKVCSWVDPLSGEPLSAQNAAKVSPDKSLDDALGQGRN